MKRVWFNPLTPLNNGAAIKLLGKCDRCRAVVLEGDEAGDDDAECSSNEADGHEDETDAVDDCSGYRPVVHQLLNVVSQTLTQRLRKLLLFQDVADVHQQFHRTRPRSR